MPTDSLSDYPQANQSLRLLTPPNRRTGAMLLIKIGGGKALNREGICRDISVLSREQTVIVVHGASAYRDEIAAELHIPTRTVESPSGITSVFTDEAAIDVFLMAYCGLVNKKIVALLQRYGVNALGLSGVDGALWQAKAKKEIPIKEGNKIKLLKGNLTGRVEEINVGLLRLLLENGYLPVICPPALSDEKEIVNTDNDLAISVMVRRLKIKKMVSLFEAPGLLENPDDESSLITKVNKYKINQYLSSARSRMKKKILGAQKSVESGVETIYWGDGRIESPVLRALEGKGTVIS